MSPENSQKRLSQWLSELWLVLKLLGIAGVISAGMKWLGLWLHLDTPPVWVPLTVVGGTMAGTALLLVWQSGRDNRPSESARNSCADADRRPLPPSETGD
jgi:hypothetical protein